MFCVLPTYFDYQYCAQVIERCYSEGIGATDELFYNFIMSCWSYLSSFLPISCIIPVDPSNQACILPNAPFRKWKMPYPIQCLTKNMEFKAGSTLYLPQIQSSSFNWTHVYQGADTSAQSYWSTPLYLSSSVPSDPMFGGKTWTVSDYDVTYIQNSWYWATEGYKIMLKTSGCFGMASTVPKKMRDCGCIAETKQIDSLSSRSNTVLGSYIIRVIWRLNCPTRMPVAACCKSSSFSWRVPFETPVQMKGSRQYMDNSDSELSSAITVSVSASQTNVQVLQSGKSGIDSYVNKQLSGGYDWANITASDLTEMVGVWAANSPTVQNIGTSAANRMLSALPSFVSVDEVMALAYGVGRFGAAALVTALMGRKIGFPSNGNSEL